MLKRLAVIERDEDVALVVPGHLVLATTPDAECAAERAGLPFVRPSDYLPDAEVEAIGLANFDRVDALRQRIDGILAATDEVAAGVTPADWHVFPLKVMFDALHLRDVVLRRALGSESPDEVTYFCRLAEFEPDGLVAAGENLTAQVLGWLLPRVGIAGIARDASRRLPGPSVVVKRESDPARMRLRLGRLKARAEARVLVRSRMPTVLLLDGAYGVPAIARELRRRGCRVVSLDALPSDAPPSISTWRALEGDPTVRGLFRWDGLDAWPLVVDRLRVLVEARIPAALGLFASARERISEIRPDVALTSMAAFPRQKAVCAAARSLGVPVAVSRHGELGTRDIPMVVRQDVESVDWALCWGRFEAEWVARHAPAVGAVVVGAPMIDGGFRRRPGLDRARRRLGLPNGRKVLLYAPTNLSGNFWYASRRAPSDSEYFRQQRRIVEALRAVDGVVVLVKDHPSTPRSLLAATFADDPSVTVVREGSFADLAGVADAVVLDMPSTTLVHALRTSAKVFVVDHPVLSWEPGVLEHLSDHGVSVLAVGELQARVQRDLARIDENGGSGRSEALLPLLVRSGADAAAAAADALLEIAASGSAS